MSVRTFGHIRKKKVEPCKNITWAENTVTIRSALNSQSEAKLEALAEELV